MRNTLGIAMAVLAFACGPAVGAGMSRQDYKAAKKRIAAEYQAERQKCGARYGNALDLCVAHAHAARDVAKAELEAAYKPSPRTNYDAAIARAVRVCIGLRDTAMRGPTGMPDTNHSLHWLVIEPPSEVDELTFRPPAFDASVDQGRDTSRIITAIFEAL